MAVLKQAVFLLPALGLVCHVPADAQGTKSIPVPTGFVTGHVVVSSGRVQMKTVTKDECHQINWEKLTREPVPWNVRGEPSRNGDFEEIGYYTDGFHALYKTSWGITELDFKKCNKTIGKIEKITLFDVRRHIHYTYDSSRSSVWKEVVNSKPTFAAAYLIVKGMGQRFDRAPDKSRRVAGFTCNSWLESSPSNTFEICMLTKDKTIPKSLAAGGVALYVRAKFFNESAETLVEQTVEKIDLNVMLPWSKFYPPFGTEFPVKNGPPAVREFDPE